MHLMKSIILHVVALAFCAEVAACARARREGMPLSARDAWRRHRCARLVT
jgi:hypothetical protein